MPVSYFTGVPDISIPLYEVKGKKISLPIALNYNASGLRPEVHPGWVGNGWSLSAGGVITRKANGLIDEYNRNSTGEYGYYFTHAHLNTSTWQSDATANSFPLYQPINDPEPVGTDADEQPDEFDFNFLGYSGKFFLDQTGAWQVQCDKNLKVTFQSADLMYPFVYYLSGMGGADMSKTFGKFTLTDDEGNQYIFGCLNPSTDRINTAIEYSDAMIPNGTLTTSLYATSWYLSEIISADQSETINLNYERGPFTSYIGFNYSANLSTGTIPSAGSFHGAVPCSQSSQISGLNGDVVFPVYLKSITMPTQDLEIDFSKSASNELAYPSGTGTIYAGGGSAQNAYQRVFSDANTPISGSEDGFPSAYPEDITSPTLIPYFASNSLPNVDPNIGYGSRFIWLKLDAISIKNTSLGITEKTVNFNYNNISTKRLQLNNINIADRSNTAIQNSIFTYSSTPLPAYLTTLTDHWGFNNNNTTPVVFGTNNNFAQVRAPDPTGVQTQAEILTGITYPTGGTTIFTYEPNSYASVIYRNNSVLPTAETGIAGGLRIKQITSIDNNNNSLIKKYLYVTGYSPTANLSSLPSSGVLNAKPFYSFSINGKDLSNNAFTFTSISSGPVIPLTINSSGSHIGYTNVTELLPDGSYTNYQFTNHDNGYSDIPSFSTFNPNVMDYYPCTSLDFERGKLIHKTEFNNSGTLITEDITTYSNSVTSTVNPAPIFSVNAVYSGLLGVCSSNSVGAVSRTAYSLNYAPFVPINETKNTFDLTGTNNTSTVVNTVYDQYKNVIQQNMVNSDGSTNRIYNFYAYNFANGNADNPYTAMVQQNMTSRVIQTITTRLINGAEYITGGKVYTYQIYGPGIIHNDAMYDFEGNGQISYNTFTPTTYAGYTSNGQLNLDSHFVLRQTVYYDNNGNPSSTVDNSGHINSFLWDYNGSQLSAKVVNANNTYSGITPANNLPTIDTLIFNKTPGVIGDQVEIPITIPRTGNATFSFAYNNNSAMSGNNSAEATCLLVSSGLLNGSLCLALPGGTSSCSSVPSTYTFSNVPAGNYTLIIQLSSMTGFQNYYGFTYTFTFPTYKYYSSGASSINDIAYTSFEYNNSSELSYGTGNWSGVNLSKIVSTGVAVTGHNYYTLTGSTLSSQALTPSKTYIVNYWSNTGSYTVTGSQSLSQGLTTPSGWTNYKHIVTGTSLVSITGTGNIDELQLYPSGSQMSTYTYEPLVGLKNIVDSKKEISSFQYDNFERLSSISDQYGNMNKAYTYNYTPSVHPVINSLSITAPKTITVNYTPISNCTTTLVNFVDTNTGQTGTNAGGCGGSLIISVPNSGDTYAVTITCNSSSITSTSAPATIAVP
nr:hypothetical protein [Mucilaginibacter sp. E4BP6]